MDKLVVPGTGVELVDGSIVILARFPGTKWIVHNGWYSYQGIQSFGWYFCAIPSQTILPVSDEDLKLITVVDSGCCPSYPSGSCPPYLPYPPGACPPYPPEMPPVFTKQRAWQLSRAWISVDTITQRDNLDKGIITDGKIVRVNETPDGTPGYFRWDAAKNNWVPETFGLDLDQYVTTDQVKELIEESYNSEQFGSAVQATIDQKVPPMIDDAIKPLEDSIEALADDISNNIKPELQYLKNSVPEWNELT